MSKKGIILDPVPGHAHWQNGKVERMVKRIFEASDKHLTEVGGTREEAVLEIMKVHNMNIGSTGYSPMQYALGRQGNNVGSIVPGEADRETGMGVDTMRTMLERKRKAEDAYLQANGREILRAARHHR